VRGKTIKFRETPKAYEYQGAPKGALAAEKVRTGGENVVGFESKDKKWAILTQASKRLR
jgi:hypothetical protein